MKRAIGAVSAALLAAAAAVALAPQAQATERTIVVSPHGHVTLQEAVNTLKHHGGGTVLLRGGHYHQRVAVVGARDITIAPRNAAHPVLDGKGLSVPADDAGVVAIRNSNHIVVRGLEITGYRTSKLNHVPIGIYLTGHDRDIRIAHNHVHHMGNYNKTLGSFDLNAHGIAAYGDDPAKPITQLVIAHNVVDHLHLGASESVVVNGNVTHWKITHNHIYDNNNIGIDAIGFEPTISGKQRYSSVNRARYGSITHNVVHNIKSRGNPSYWDDGEWCNCADGIYVDGGTHIHIAHNQVTRSDIGIEVAAENGRGNASHVVVEHNRISGSRYVGITTGGYCDGHKGCGGVQTGKSFDNVFRYNTLRNDNTLNDGSPELLIQYHAHHDTFVHNTITATNSAKAVYGTVPRSDSSHNRSDHNRFAAKGGSRHSAEFGWRNRTYTGFGKYRQATGQDAHSTFR